MDGGVREAVGAWASFYGALAAVSATLLGLLFVAVSLRLNLFSDAAMADVRDFAALVFGQYLGLVLLGLVSLFPRPHPATLGVPALLLGALGLGWAVRLGREYLRLNRAPGSRIGWGTAYYVAGAGTAAGTAAAGAALLARGDPAALPWLAGATLAVLVAATLGAWLLLSHARPA